MLELIKTYHQRSAIFLRKKEEGEVVASFVVFDQLNNGKLIGEKVLGRNELESIRAQRETLEKRNIFIFEEEEITPLFIGGMILPKYFELTLEAFSSPYFSSIFREKEFFSTQKTRGPNR